MFSFLKYQYNINYTSCLKITDKTYKILTNGKYYLIKEINDNNVDNIYRRLSILKVNYVLFPLKGNNDSYVQEEDDKYYIVLPFYDDEKLLAYDLKLNLHIQFLTELHKKTEINIQINNSYLESTLDYLDNEIKKVSDIITSRIEVIEKSDYHSPNDWYFLMHFKLLNEALEKASKHVLFFEKEIKKESSIRLGLTYQNFDFNHILLKESKIISFEQTAYNFTVYDLYDFIVNASYNHYSMDVLITDYLKVNPLKEYEKEYLMALLYTFNYYRYENMLDDLSFLIKLVDYLQLVNRIEDEIIFYSDSEK